MCIRDRCGGLTPKYERLGKDLEEYNIELNPDTETSKNILGETTFKHNGYEASSEADPFYAETDSDLFKALQKIVDERLKDDNLKTKAVEVHLWTEEASGAYEAYQQECYVCLLYTSTFCGNPSILLFISATFTPLLLALPDPPFFH